MAYKQGLGYYVAGVAKAHANGDVNTFLVSAGGLAVVNLIYGVVTVAAGGACTITAGIAPTAGTTVVWSVATDVDTMLVGDIITFNYVAGTLTTVVSAVAGLTGVSANFRVMVQAGNIFVRGSAVQGTSQWFLYYIPLVAGTLITAVP